MQYRTQLARVRGLGAAKDGTHHWWLQRVTAIALVPLSVWLVFSLQGLSHATLEQTQIWLASPLRALLLLAFIGASAWHAKLGIQVIVEDYVHGHFGKYALLLANTLGFALLFIMAAMAILKLHLL